MSEKLKLLTMILAWDEAMASEYWEAFLEAAQKEIEELMNA